LQPGQCFEFIIELDKLEKIKRVIAHNEGKIVKQTMLRNGMQLKVVKE